MTARSHGIPPSPPRRSPSPARSLDPPVSPPSTGRTGTGHWLAGQTRHKETSKHTQHAAARGSARQRAARGGPRRACLLGGPRVVGVALSRPRPSRHSTSLAVVSGGRGAEAGTARQAGGRARGRLRRGALVVARSVAAEGRGARRSAGREGGQGAGKARETRRGKQGAGEARRAARPARRDAEAQQRSSAAARRRGGAAARRRGARVGGQAGCPSRGRGIRADRQARLSVAPLLWRGCGRRGALALVPPRWRRTRHREGWRRRVCPCLFRRSARRASRRPMRRGARQSRSICRLAASGLERSLRWTASASRPGRKVRKWPSDL